MARLERYEVGLPSAMNRLLETKAAQLGVDKADLVRVAIGASLGMAPELNRFMQLAGMIPPVLVPEVETLPEKVD